jgi:hypothetical protein
MQSDRIRLLCRVFVIKAFVWIRVQNPEFRGAACGGLMAAANGQQGLRRMPDGTRRRNSTFQLCSLCASVLTKRVCVPTRDGF